MIVFETERLIIRDPKPEDIDGYHRVLSDELTMHFGNSSSSFEMNFRNFEGAINEINNDCRIKYFFTFECRVSKQYIGTVGYTVVGTTPVGKIVGAGYAILPEYRGKGYTTEAFQALIHFAFEKNDVYRLVAGCRAENQASVRVMQKCGMIKEAEFKRHTWHDGQMKDRLEYRLLKEEYYQKIKLQHSISNE